MPNHITTQVEISGTKEQIADLVEKTKIIRDGEATDNQFDFNGIVKMPEELLNTTSPTDVVETQEEADRLNTEKRELWEKNKYGSYTDKAISKAESERRLKEYGAVNWYDWSYPNWGTKWNAYDVHYTDGNDTKIVIQIDTAWNTPTAIWEALEEKGYTVKGVMYGEMEGFEYIGEGADEVWEAYTSVEVDYIG